MATPDDEPGPAPVDPVYASLFRPEEPAPAAPAPTETPDPEPHAAEPDDPEAAPVPPEASPVEPAESPVPRAAADADTGRLFRSQGVTGHESTVLALSSDHGGRLRTLTREQDAPARPSVAVGAAATAAAVVTDAPDSGPVPRLAADAGPVEEEAPVPDERRRDRRASGHRSPGISAGAVYIIVIGVTLIIAVVNAWLGKGELGWPTGLALVIASVYCALRVRREDDIVAFIIPPIAFFIAAVTAGQAFRGPNGGGLINRAQLIFFTLAYNWYWVIGATVAALVIVLVRRRRG